jgi:two-component system cell cycle response regulator PopA
MRILIRAKALQAARAAQEALARAGYEAVALPGGAETRRMSEPDADILILPAAGADDSEAGAFLSLAQGSGSPALATLLALPAGDPPPASLAPLFGFDGALSLEVPPALLKTQMAAHLRAAVIREECARRRGTAIVLGQMAMPPQETRALSALYIGAPCAQFLNLEQAVLHQGGRLDAAFTSYSGFDHLHDEVFDAVILNALSEPDTALSLCSALRRNSRLHHLPTLMITGDSAVSSAALDRGAAAIIGAHGDQQAALGWLLEAVRRERGRLANEHELNALRDSMGDARTGLMRDAPFEAHLDRLAQSHQQSGRALSVVALRVLPAFGATRPTDAEWRKGFAEIASLAGRLVRAADSAAAFGEDRIVIALPASALSAAKRVAERVVSVAECTSFASGGDHAAPLIIERSLAELQPGESGAGLLARATAKLSLRMDFA